MVDKSTGCFIVFEGIDGCGKSTQLKRLADSLRRQGYGVIETREPTEGRYGQMIRALYRDRSAATPQRELELFIEDRREHIQLVIQPALERGKIVLCDRYFFSTAAYQGAAGCDPEEIIALHGFAPVPDLVIIIEIEPRESIRRITEKRGDQPNDFEQLESLEKVDSIFSQMDLPYMVRIDGSASEHEVHQQVMELVKRLLARLNLQEQCDPQ
jgi:dTMP kinase